MTGIIRLSEDYSIALSRSKQVLAEGGVLIAPTDTVYGFLGNALDTNVINRICRIKGRETKTPLSVIMPSFDMLKYYCRVSTEKEGLLKKYLPGPYTFILEMRIQIPVSNDGTIGVRIPDHPFSQRIAFEFGKPLISTSANISGNSPPYNIFSLDKHILNSVDLIIDGGDTKHGLASTVVDLINDKVLRYGAGEFNF